MGDVHGAFFAAFSVASEGTFQDGKETSTKVVFMRIWLELLVVRS